MLRIERLVLREIQLRLKEPFRISSGVSHTRRIPLVQLFDRSGMVGWGECVAGETPHYSAETVETSWLAIRQWIAPLVVGREFKDPPAIYHTLGAAFRGHRMAKACVEMASWDLAAQMANLPLARMLGGTRDWIATGISLGIEESPERLVEKARGAMGEGYRRIKLKIAPGTDVANVRSVRRALGPKAPVMVDANCAYTPADTMVLRQLDELDLLMIEQPFAHDDLVRHAALQRQLRTPICLDEAITGPERAEDMIALESGKIINIKPGRVGGHTGAIAIHDLAVAHRIPVWCGGMLESGIGRAHNVALASLGGFTMPGDLSPSARYWDHDIVSPPWTMEDGMVTVPLDRQGLGVDVDVDRVDGLTERLETFD